MRLDRSAPLGAGEQVDPRADDVLAAGAEGGRGVERAGQRLPRLGGGSPGNSDAPVSSSAAVPLTATMSPWRAAREYDARRSKGLPLLSRCMSRR